MELGRVELGDREASQENSNCFLGTQGRAVKCSDFSLFPSAEEKSDWEVLIFFSSILILVKVFEPEDKRQYISLLKGT